MNRSKILPKLIILGFLGIFIFSVIPVVTANEGKVTERPLDDWLIPNWNFFWWGEQNWAFADFVSPYTGYVAKMGFPWPCDNEICGFGSFVEDMVYENSLVSGDTIIDGNIKERELADGTALVTLQLDVKNAPLTMYDIYDLIFYCFGLTPEAQAILGAGEDGYIDYKVLIKFIIPYPGAPLPIVLGVWDNYISCNIHGIGYGTLTEYSANFGYTPGAEAMVELHQICLFKPDFKEDHPKYDPLYGDLWPVETVEIYEI